MVGSDQFAKSNNRNVREFDDSFLVSMQGSIDGAMVGIPWLTAEVKARLQSGMVKGWVDEHMQ